MKIQVEIYTDGSFDPKTKRGGWANLVSGDKEPFMMFDSVEDTTINRMELLSVIEGLNELSAPCEVKLTSDSRYVVDMIKQEWISKWERDGWKLSSGQPVKNLDLVKRLSEQLKKHDVEANWVKSHNGHHENEICDKVAKSQAFIK